MPQYYTNYEKNNNRSSTHSCIKKYCYLCGILLDNKGGNKQKEHVIPKFLIGKQNSLILSACNNCNKYKGVIEERMSLLFGILSHNDNKPPAYQSLKTIRGNIEDKHVGLIKKEFQNFGMLCQVV